MLGDTANGWTDKVCKVRSITLNFFASQLVNFEVIRNMILGTGGEPTTVTVHTERKVKLKREGRGTVSIVTEPEDKLCRISFFKQRRLGDNTLAPFSYK